MLVFRSLFSNNCDFRSGCGHFWCPKLSFGRPGGSILAPWGKLWHLGGALGGHRSSRKDILGSRVGFLLILGGFRDPILRAFLVLWSNTGVFFSCLFPGSFLLIFWYESGRMELEKQAFGVRGCAKTNLSQMSGFCRFQGQFFMFFCGLGTNLHDFWCLGNRLEI